jgi:hypothetical protein
MNKFALKAEKLVLPRTLKRENAENTPQSNSKNILFAKMHTLFGKGVEENIPLSPT